MAIKIVQNTNRISPSASIASTSNPIPLKSGYIRVSTASTGAFVEVGSDPVATYNSFHLPPFGTEVIKERFVKQRISGITTGASTVLSFSDMNGHAFVLGDKVSIENGYPSGINTSHSTILSLTETTITLDYDTSTLTGVAVTSASASRSIKVSALGDGVATNVSIAEVVQLVSE
jgi:hypothetical protein